MKCKVCGNHDDKRFKMVLSSASLGTSPDGRENITYQHLLTLGDYGDKPQTAEVFACLDCGILQIEPPRKEEKQPSS